MPRVDGIRERIHQPFWDTLTRGLAVGTVNNDRSLFGTANVGQPDLTNLATPGQLDSDKTYIVKSLRTILQFQATNDAAFNVAFGTIPAVTNTIATNKRAQMLYALCAYGSQFSLKVGDKELFVAPNWYVPAGGGPSGFTTENSSNVITNGVPSHEAVLFLGKDIHIPARQALSVKISFFPFVRLGTGLGAGGAAVGADIDPLLYLNQFDGYKLFQFMLDGKLTRDVQ